jgi:hypothetical protein
LLQAAAILGISRRAARLFVIGTLLLAGISVGLITGCVASSESNPALRNGEKEVPEITFKNLTPPYLDYDYFQGHDTFPFQYNATAFSLVNAWWLAEASTLVYAEENFARSQFGKAGLPDVRFFKKLSTQCYVAHNDNFAIVAFRGSEIWKKRERFDIKEVTADLRTDLDIWPVDWVKGGKVHRGFRDALDEVWPELLPLLRELDGKGCKIWITGHSLGGALATLCAARYGRAQGAYTFGAPRVGNDEFRAHLAVDIYRVVNNEDIVPRLPMLGIYVHAGKLELIDGDGILREAAEEAGPSALSGETEADVREESSRSKNDSFKGFVPAAFRDHVPLLYAIHLWNNIIRNRDEHTA